MHLHGTVRTVKVLGDSVLVQQSLKKVSLTWAGPYTFKLFKIRYVLGSPMQRGSTQATVLHCMATETKGRTIYHSSIIYAN